METRLEATFNRDLRRIRNPILRRRIQRAVERVEAASIISEIPGIERLSARGRFYRIRVGEYRIGAEIEDNVVTLVRFGHRSVIYRNFP